MKFTGTVVRKPVNVGSKSEHVALALVTPEGEYQLRREGGNAFWDDELAKLEGKLIEGEGAVRAGQFIMKKWRLV